MYYLPDVRYLYVYDEAARHSFKEHRARPRSAKAGRETNIWLWRLQKNKELLQQLWYSYIFDMEFENYQTTTIFVN